MTGGDTSKVDSNPLQTSNGSSSGASGSGSSSNPNNTEELSKSENFQQYQGTVANIVKLPEFWTQCPATWFITVENIFDLQKIKTDKQRYQYVLASLPQHVVMRVSDIVSKGNGVYADLKSELIQRFSLSEEQRLNTLLSESNATMGDKRPSEFFIYLEQLADTGLGVSKELLLKLWMRRLPDNIYSHLTASRSQEENVLVPMADRLWDSMQKNCISAVSNFSSNPFAPSNFPNQSFVQHNNSPFASSYKPSSSNNELSIAVIELTKQIKNLQGEINEIKSERSQSFRGRSRFRSRTPSHNFGRSPNRSQSRSGRDTCWYHYNFGSKARKCTPPCKFAASTSSTPSTPSKN